MRSELVKSVPTGQMRRAPISAAFSTMKSVRAFLIGAKSNQRSGGACWGADWAATSTGLTSPFAPGNWAVHAAGDLFFTDGVADLGQGLEAVAEDGSPDALDASLASNDLVSSYGIFNTPVGASAAGPIFPGGSYSATFTAAQGEFLSFATMFVQSNDLFIGPAGAGIQLWNGDVPLSGDITNRLQLWDAGTEVNQWPGAGVDQAPRQGGPDTGADEGGVVQDIQDVNDGFTYPAVSDMIRVTLDLQ